MNRWKGHFLVIVGGAVLLVAAVFLALQWGSSSTISAFGPEVPVPTVWLLPASAAGGVVVYWACRLMIRGCSILRRARREERKGQAAPAGGSQGADKSP